MAAAKPGVIMTVSSSVIERDEIRSAISMFCGVTNPNKLTVDTRRGHQTTELDVTVAENKQFSYLTKYVAVEIVHAPVFRKII